MSCRAAPHPAPAGLLLPEAPPQLYLRWLTWHRRVERRALATLRAHPHLRESIRRVHGPMSLCAAVVVQDIREQVLAARRAGLGQVAPRLAVTWRVASLGVGYLAARRRWLSDLPRGAGPPAPRSPGWDVLVLHGRVLAAIRRMGSGGPPGAVAGLGSVDGSGHPPGPPPPLPLAS
jgi:hypothetical protein